MPFINYVEFNSGDLEASTSFYREVFDWVFHEHRLEKALH